MDTVNVDKLSKRLETVVSYIEKGMSIADIGSDHAYLPCYAVKKGIVSRAIAGEVVEGPYQSARKQVASVGLNDIIDVRKGNGLAVIEAGEVDAIVIAGMGGTLITDILEAGKEKLQGVKRLILQPNIAADVIRNWLVRNGWQLVDEEILEEDGKFYEVLVAERGEITPPYSVKELMLGPFILKKKNDAFYHKWQQEIEQWEHILQELNKAEQNEKVHYKKESLLNVINMVKGELK